MYIKTFQHEIPAFDVQPEHVRAAAEVRDDGIVHLITAWLKTVFAPAQTGKH